MKKRFFSITVIIFILSNCSVILSQSARSFNNSGVDLYEEKKYNDSEINFKKSIEKINQIRKSF
jgi:hypothetical protein